MHAPYAVGLDLNTAFLAAAARLTVGLSAPDHFVAPKFNPKIPGSWLVDLSHVEIDPRLPSPFTPDGTRPTGPAWYQTHTVAYAQELGYNVEPLEAYLRRETGAYLDPWHDRLKAAYVDTLADMGVTKDLTDAQFLAAMEQHKQVDPVLTAVLAAIKGTVKGGIGKLFENPQGKGHKDGEPWPAMMRPTWRPDIRAAVISKARVNMHRKLANMAKMTGMYPLAVLSDCVVYPAPSASPLDFLPYAASGKPQPGAFRLGPTPGLAKLEGVQDMPGRSTSWRRASTRPATSRATATTPSWTKGSRPWGRSRTPSSGPTGRRSPDSRPRPSRARSATCSSSSAARRPSRRSSG